MTPQRFHSHDEESDRALAQAKTWRDSADVRLKQLYDAAALEGRKPTKQEIFDGYPFGQRQYTPYKVWLEQVKRWDRGGPLRLPSAVKQPIAALPGQEPLL